MFASVWAILLPLSFLSAHVGVLLWVWVALLAPNDLFFGFINEIPFNKLVAGTTFLCMIANREKKDFYLDKTLITLILFAISVTISLQTEMVVSPLSAELYQKIMKEIVLAFVICYVMNTRHRLHLLTLIIAISYGYLAVKEGLISMLTAGGHAVIGSVSVGDNNSLATALLMIMPLTYYLIQHSALRTVRLSLWAALGLTVVTVIATNSRGGFLGLLVVGGYMVKNSRQRVPMILVILAVAVTIFVFAPAAWFQRLSTIESVDNDTSFMGRVVAWKISLLIALDNPLFGGGLHAVQQLFVWFKYRPYLSSLSFIQTPEADDHPHAAHSVYFETLGDLGFIGCGLFVSLILLSLWNCRRVTKMTENTPSLAWATDLSRMLQVSMVVYAITAAALSLAYFELFYILVALSSRCRRTAEQALAAQHSEAIRAQAREAGRLRAPTPQYARVAAQAAEAGRRTYAR